MTLKKSGGKKDGVVVTGGKGEERQVKPKMFLHEIKDIESYYHDDD